MNSSVYIKNGIAVDAGWTSSIAISKDGVNWDLLPKRSLTISRSSININNSAPNALDKVLGTREYIILRNAESDIEIKVDPTKVKGQTWASATAAIADIGDWIAVLV
jgi:hypothetical protein